MGMIQFYAGYAKSKLGGFVRDERGDTNFISIIVILAIVIVVAGVFIGFGSQIIDWVNTNLLGKGGLTGMDSTSNPLSGLAK